MTTQEKIELAEKQIEQAEIMLNSTRKALLEWENLLDLRRETLASLKATLAKPFKSKPIPNKTAMTHQTREDPLGSADKPHGEQL